MLRLHIQVNNILFKLFVELYCIILHICACWNIWLSMTTRDFLLLLYFNSFLHPSTKQMMAFWVLWWWWVCDGNYFIVYYYYIIEKNQNLDNKKNHHFTMENLSRKNTVCNRSWIVSVLYVTICLRNMIHFVWIYKLYLFTDLYS